MFEILYSKQAIKFLNSAEQTIAKRIAEKLDALEAIPVPKEAKTIQGYGEKLFRVWVGDCS